MAQSNSDTVGDVSVKMWDRWQRVGSAVLPQVGSVVLPPTASTSAPDPGNVPSNLDIHTCNDLMITIQGTPDLISRATIITHKEHGMKEVILMNHNQEIARILMTEKSAEALWQGLHPAHKFIESSLKKGDKA